MEDFLPLIFCDNTLLIIFIKSGFVPMQCVGDVITRCNHFLPVTYRMLVVGHFPGRKGG